MPRAATSETEHARYQRQRYASDADYRERSKAYVRKYRPKRLERMRALLLEIKAAGCARCPEKDPIVLEFHHHYGPRSFTLSPSNCAQKGIATVEAELAKCIVLCANCHRRHHRTEPV